MGCKSNQFESSIISENLENNGINQTKNIEEADFYILNSCTVTHKSDNEAMYHLRNAKHKNSNIKTVITGCVAQVEKEKLLEKIKQEKIELDSETPIENLGFGNLVDYLYKKVARPHMLGPIYLVEHPSSLSPLARTNDSNKNISDRFQLVINGAEIVNGYSELVDPQEQERKLLEQASLKANGDEEAMDMDYDYIGAMEYGMPPISGWGMGIDRMIQLLTNSDNIKDVVMFPLMKPENKD